MRIFFKEEDQVKQKILACGYFGAPNKFVITQLLGRWKKAKKKNAVPMKH